MTAPSGTATISDGDGDGERGKPAVVAVGFWRPATGFARVIERILAPQADRYDIHLIGIGYTGPVQAVPAARGGAITVYPCNLRGGDVFGAYQTAEMVDTLRPALVFLVNDFWLLARYPRVLARCRERPPVVCYCPLDGRIVDDAPFAALAPVHRLVVYTAFAERELRGAAARLRERGAAAAFPEIEAIPHGVDTELFRPLAGDAGRQNADGGREAAKRRCFPDLPDPSRSFVVLNANRIQPRKRIDLTLAGFARFAAGKPAHVRLALHAAASTPEERADLRRQADALGIGGRVMIGPSDDRPLADGELNDLYNACDVGVNTAMGEGWGLVSFEHGATAAAQVVPRHSACAELWAGAAELVEPGEAYVPPFAPLEMAAVSPEGVASALERLYANDAHRRAMAHSACRNAARPAYDWRRIAAQWRRVFDDAATGGTGGGASW